MTSILDVTIPRLEISLDKIFHNAEFVVKKSRESGIQVVGITKGCAGNSLIAKSMIAAGVSSIGDAHISNILQIKKAGIDVPFWFIRSPLSSQMYDIAENTFLSLNCEASTINAMVGNCKKKVLNHKIAIMIELGDKREGILPDDLLQFLDDLSLDSCKRIAGIGTTLGCLTLNYPTENQIYALKATTKKVMEILNTPLEIITVGGSSFIPLLLTKPFSFSGITHIRIGEAILLGTDGLGENIEHLYQDTLQLVAEVIEVHSYSRISDDKHAKEIIVGLGYQDIDIFGLSVTNLDGTNILAATSDHLILACPHNVEIDVGKEIRLKLTYKSMLRAFLSPYIHKAFI